MRTLPQQHPGFVYFPPCFDKVNGFYSPIPLSSLARSAELALASRTAGQMFIGAKEDWMNIYELPTKLSED